MSTSIQVTRTVSASPEQMFAVLSTPARHTDLDGSSMLRGLGSEGEAPVTKVGDQFVMKMHNDALGDYQMRSTITAFEPNHTIGWAPELYPADAYKDKVGEMKAVGHTFTWTLEPAESGTKVTQVYDWSGVTDEQFLGMFPLLTEQMLTDSIDRTAELAG